MDPPQFLPGYEHQNWLHRPASSSGTGLSSVNPNTATLGTTSAEHDQLLNPLPEPDFNEPQSYEDAIDGLVSLLRGENAHADTEVYVTDVIDVTPTGTAIAIDPANPPVMVAQWSYYDSGPTHSLRTEQSGIVAFPSIGQFAVPRSLSGSTETPGTTAPAPSVTEWDSRDGASHGYGQRETTLPHQFSSATQGSSYRSRLIRDPAHIAPTGRRSMQINVVDLSGQDGGTFHNLTNDLTAPIPVQPEDAEPNVLNMLAPGD